MTLIQQVELPGCGCESAEAAAKLISMEAALVELSALAGPVEGHERLPLVAATGRILAEAVHAQGMTPPFDNAAMDGYALRTWDLTGTGPWRLPVADYIAAGDGARRDLAPGTAAQILTGAALPAGADAVVMQEAVTRDGEVIILGDRCAHGDHIRRAGEDMRTGERVLRAGCRLGPRDIAAAAAAGVAEVDVRRRVRVALLTTGDEVRAPGSGLDWAQIWDVNTPMLAVALTMPHVEITAVEAGRDDLAGLTAQLARLAGLADLLITTGGISVGVADHVKPALLRAGGAVTFSGVAIKPGKPVSAGRIGNAVWLGLPGNPVSAFTTWSVFGSHLLTRLAGRETAEPRRHHVISTTPLSHRPGRCELRLATLAGFDASGREVVTCPEQTHSARVGILAAADGAVLLPAETSRIPAGGLLEFLPFHDF